MRRCSNAANEHRGCVSFLTVFGNLFILLLILRISYLTLSLYLTLRTLSLLIKNRSNYSVLRRVHRPLSILLGIPANVKAEIVETEIETSHIHGKLAKK